MPCCCATRSPQGQDRVAGAAGRSGLLFIIACANVANLILARTVRREGELAIREALGASTGALRRTLLAESLLLCGAGAALGVLIARPMVAILARYASRSRFARSISRSTPACCGPARCWRWRRRCCWRTFRACRRRAARAVSAVGTPARESPAAATRRLRLLAVTQIAASFVLLVGAAMLLKTLLTLQEAETGFDTRHVLS